MLAAVYRQALNRGPLAGLCVLTFGCALVAQPPPPATSARKLAVGQPVQDELERGEADVFAVEAVGGQLLKVVVREKGSDIVFSIIDPGGNTLATADTPGDPDSRLPAYWIVTQPGIYSVRVAKAEQSEETVRYEIELANSGQPSET